MNSSRVRRRDLNELARFHGLQRSYEDVNGERHHASPEALFLTLRALGASLHSPADAPAALQAGWAEREARGIEPVHVAWGGRLSWLPLRVTTRAANSPARLTLRLESGEVRNWQASFEVTSSIAPGATHRLHLPDALPLGYHDLEVAARGRSYHTRIISAPRRAYTTGPGCTWGVFAPLYAVRTERDDGAGDFSDLARLARWIGECGGDYIGTLPLLASFVDRPFEPSPYSPVSRLFWNEFYVAPGERSPAAALPAEVGALVDYRAVARRRRRALTEAATAFFRTADQAALAEYRQFVASRTRLPDYARFRAVCDRQATGWHGWPQRLRDGDLREGDYAPEDEQYYRYAQWQAERQLSAIHEAGRAGAAALYLDLPLGVNPNGYDAWRFRDLFLEGVSVGAPPDTLFTGGQDWGFRPLSPARLRASGYGYLIESIRHHLRHARMLRLDHIMSLFRLYWIPAGLTAKEGVYAQYPAAELLAVLLTESARHEAGIVGEDLGTVPREVRRVMRRRSVLRSYVVQYELAPDREPPLNEVPRDAVASINTHDMPPFAAFVHAAEVDDQVDLGLLNDAEAERARSDRASLRQQLEHHFDADTPRALLDALLCHLATSDARTVLVNLEDLWLETAAQNVPGTDGEQRPNWRRRFARTLEQILADPGIAETLRVLAERRGSAAVVAATPNFP